MNFFPNLFFLSVTFPGNIFGRTNVTTSITDITFQIKTDSHVKTKETKIVTWKTKNAYHYFV